MTLSVSTSVTASPAKPSMHALPSLPFYAIWDLEKTDNDEVRAAENDESDKGFQLLPNELLGKIVDYLEDPKDTYSFRGVSTCFLDLYHRSVAKKLSDSTVFPANVSMVNFLKHLKNPDIAKYVRELTILAEGLSEHIHGYAWAWEDLLLDMGVPVEDEDVNLINRINDIHHDDSLLDDAFHASGIYRNMLTTLLRRCPNLKTIYVRKLKAGEHIPGWRGVKLFKDLSFYEAGMDFRKIFYGGWQYDLLHKRVTFYYDIYDGHWYFEDCAGPQARFIDDLEAAVNACGRRIEQRFILPDPLPSRPPKDTNASRRAAQEAAKSKSHAAEAPQAQVDADSSAQDSV
ncbi:hypothetical protein E8E13_003331 [Curvularia kusanoi]|uniref:F-box domain-containing protein n=1 Tax=Curvularia kusanoi TaxID=90978 RepID=A0A9P4W3J3_CURKU|nr:hypothetical protein E8E13_003331 [Curvularia kusanoi]